MDIILYSTFIIVVTTVFYIYVLKPELTLDILNDTQKLIQYNSSYFKSLAFYFLIIIGFQYFFNSSYLMVHCSENIGKNMSSAALYTFVPWILIFGVVVAIIYLFPDFKSAFSNVIGIYFISSTAKELLSKLFGNSIDINKIIQETNDPNQKDILIQSADLLLKTLGNNSVLMNELTTYNFLDIWNKLEPFMKPQTDTNIKQSLLNLVIQKENIGESLWYIYTGILVSSFIFYNLSSRGCIKDVNGIMTEHTNFLKKKEQEQKKIDLNNLTSYVT